MWFHGAMAEKEVVVDALPYFDQGYDESGVKEAVSIKVKSTPCFPLYCIQ